MWLMWLGLELDHGCMYMALRPFLAVRLDLMEVHNMLKQQDVPVAAKS